MLTPLNININNFFLLLSTLQKMLEKVRRMRGSLEDMICFCLTVTIRAVVHVSDFGVKHRAVVLYIGDVDT